MKKIFSIEFISLFPKIHSMLFQNINIYSNKLNLSCFFFIIKRISFYSEMKILIIVVLVDKNNVRD